MEVKLKETRVSSRLALLFSLPLVLTFVLFGRWFLLMFGPEFQRESTALAILRMGQFVSVAAGSVGLILIMTSHEDDTFKGLLVVAIANVILNGFLISICGIEGAAVASATSTIIWNIPSFHPSLIKERSSKDSLRGVRILEEDFRLSALFSSDPMSRGSIL